ncbi:hypothetical protein HYU91_02350, partial [Candidatus Collierbacteria bacterium]|nr:hypothetical protein [Candidatus Collierbacteria bacterium]
MNPIAQSTPPTMPPAPKPSIVPVILSIFLCISLAGIGLLAYQNIQLQRQIASLQLQPTPTPLPAEVSTKEGDPTANWKTYTNTKLGFSIQYPSNLKVSQEPQPYKNNLGGTTWFLSIDDRADGDAAGKTIGTSISVQFNDKPISGESGQPITKIENTVMGIENVTYFNIQNYPAVKGRQNINPDQNGVAQETILFVHILQGKLLWSITGDAKSTKDAEINKVNQILSTFKFTGATATTTPTLTITPTSKPKTTYVVPTSWKRLTTQSGLNLCLPPKWEAEAYDHLIFNRDEGYKPSITYITNLPYSGGSRREAYFAYWANEYPDVKQLVSVTDTDING